MAEARLSHHLHGSVALVVLTALCLMPGLAQTAYAAPPRLAPASVPASHVAAPPSAASRIAGKPSINAVNEHARDGHRNFGASGSAGAPGVTAAGHGGFGSLMRGEASGRTSITVSGGEALDVSGNGFLRIAVPHGQVRRVQAASNTSLVTLDATDLHTAARAVVNTSGSTEASSATGRSGAIFLGGKPGSTHQ